MTDTDRPDGDGAAERRSATAESVFDHGAQSGSTPPRKTRVTIVGGAVLAAILVAGGILSSTIGLEPAWGTLVGALSSAQQPKVVVWRDVDGIAHRTTVNRVKYDALVAEQRTVLDAAHLDTRAAAKTRIEADVAAVFSDIDDRVPQYGEWYYRYTTKYLLMTHGAMGLWGDFLARAANQPFTLEQAIGLIQGHLTDYLEAQYADKVLRPDRTEAQLQAAYDQDLAKLHEEWLTVLVAEQQRFAEFLTTQNGVVVSRADSAALDDEKLDWNFSVGDAAHKTTVTVQKFRRGLLSIAVSRPRKYAVPGAPPAEPEQDSQDSTEESDEIAHVISNLFSAIIDPLAAQFSALLASTVAGGFAGGMTGGLMTIPVAATPGLVLSAPLVGAAIGAAITVGTDITATRLEERMTRADFEQSLRDTLAKTQKAITDTLVATLFQHADLEFAAGSRHLEPPPAIDKKPGSSAPQS
jgi:hypothetical protein